jgi:hypothetical protein
MYAIPRKRDNNAQFLCSGVRATKANVLNFHGVVFLSFLSFLLIANRTALG